MEFNQEYGEDGNAAVVRFLALKEYLSERWGPPTDDRLHWNEHERIHPNQKAESHWSLWGNAIASGHFSLFTSWVTAGMEIWLSCDRHGAAGVFTSMEYRPNDEIDAQDTDPTPNGE